MAGPELDALPAGAIRSRCFAFALTSHGLAVTIAWGAIDEAEAR